MAPIDNDAIGLTLRELVLEVRADVRDLKEDLAPRVARLEKKAVETEAVAVALKNDRTEIFSKRDKVLGTIAAIITLSVQIYVASGGH